MRTACRPNASFALLLPVLLGAAAVAQPVPRLVLASPEAESAGRFGGAVSSAGDVDGDGVDDLLVGAYSETVGGLFSAGRVYVFSGADGALLHTLESPNAEFGGDFGNAVAGLGDTDSDGVPDLVVGAQFESVGGSISAGRVYVFSGASGALLRTLTSPDPAGGFFGTAVVGVGDVDGDDADDFIVGASGEDGGGVDRSGRAYVFSGATGALLHTLETPAPQVVGLFGGAVAGLGDTDDDGTPDLLVGARQEDGGEPNAGRAYVFSGASGALLHTLESPNPDPLANFGAAVAGLGDTDDDGTPDFAVGASGEDRGGFIGAGRAYVFSGASGALLHTLESPNPEEVGAFGYALAGLADLDADGVDEIVVGAVSEDNGDGRVYVFAGASGALLATLASPQTADFGDFGAALASVASADGGGRPGLIVGAPREDVGGVTGGRAYVFAGPRGVALEPPVPVEPAVTVGPNPFRDRAVLTVVLVAPSVVRLSVYDGLGRGVSVLHDGPLGAGTHGFVLDGRGWPSGVYEWRLVAGAHVTAGTLTRLR